MTLDSRVYIDSPKLSAREVLDQMQLILCKHDERGRKPADIRERVWSDEIGNDIDQGLPALVGVYHNGERPIREDADACHEYCDTEPDVHGEVYHYHKPRHWLCVSMDTAYGYRAADGKGCGDLHALMIAELGQWLDANEAPWSWQNEFTGDIHGGADRYERLIDLATGGFEATAWFQASVLPAILGGAL